MSMVVIQPYLLVSKIKKTKTMSMLNWLPKLHKKISKARLIKNAGEILDKLRARDLNATSLSTYDFSTLYTT